MKTPSELKQESLNALKGNWAPSVLLMVLYAVILAIFSGGDSLAPVLGFKFPLKAQMAVSGGTTLVSLLFLAPFGIGVMNAFRMLLTNADTDLIHNSFHFGFGNYKHIVLGYLLMEIKILLWTLCLIIPGIIKTFAYAMTPYILVENPEMGLRAAIERSEDMMRGHKFDLFYFYLTFIGWAILCVLTAGIGFFWLAPYVETGLAAFYEDVKREYSEIEG